MIGLASGRRPYDLAYTYTGIQNLATFGGCLLQLRHRERIRHRGRSGRRVVDIVTSANVGIEVKAGRTSLTVDTMRQVIRDTELVAADQLASVEWHFFRSPVTGEVGPTGPLAALLERAGITVVMHP